MKFLNQAGKDVQVEFNEEDVRELKKRLKNYINDLDYYDEVAPISAIKLSLMVFNDENYILNTKAYYDESIINFIINDLKYEFE